MTLDESASLKGGNRMIMENTALMLAGIEWSNILIPLSWFAVIVLTIMVENQTADLISIWFAPGALVSLILSFCGVELWVQLVVFIGVTVAGMVLSFAVLRPMMRKRRRIVLTNADALAGRTVQVLEDVNNAIPTGVIKVNGQLWTARMEDPYHTASKGEWVIIVRVEGSKVICRNKD
jgi:membrane protein implicated in regulation of membrane protease activity